MDSASAKLVTEWDKMGAKLGSTEDDSLLSKDAIKYLKHLLKLFSSLMKNKDSMNNFANGNILDKHYRPLSESIKCLLLRKQELPIIKDVRLCILVILPEKVKQGFSSKLISIQACNLYYWIILAGIEEKEFSLISIAHNSAIMKLQEAKTDIEVILEQEFSYFGLMVPKIRPNKPTFFKSSMIDTKICPFLYMPVSSPPESEIELIMEQILMAYTTVTLVKGCQRLKNLRYRSEEEKKVEKEDMALMTCIRLLFNEGLHRLPITDNVALKCIFIDALRDSKWFWSIQSKLSLGLDKLVMPNTFTSESMYLVSSCHRKLALKLTSNYYCKSPDLKESQTKILTYFSQEFTKYLECALVAIENDKYRSIRQDVLVDLKAVLISCLGVIDKDKAQDVTRLILEKFKAASNLSLKPLDSECLSSLFRAVDFNSSNSFKIATKLMYMNLVEGLETFPKQGMKVLPSIVQTLTIYTEYFSSFPFSSSMVTAMSFKLVDLALTYISEGQFTQAELNSIGPLVTALRHCLEVASLSKEVKLVTHAHNDIESMKDLISSSSKLIKIIAVFLSKIPASNSELIAMDLCMLLRLNNDKEAEQSLNHVIENSVLRASMSNVPFFRILQTKSPIEHYENTVILSAFGIDTLELLIKNRRAQVNAVKCLRMEDMIIEDTRIVEFYRTNIDALENVNTTTGETDFFLSDGKSILQVQEGEIIVRTDNGMYAWKFSEGSRDRKTLMNFLFLHGWLPPDLYKINKYSTNFDKLLAALDEKESQIQVKIGCVILPDINAVAESMRANEDFEKLLVRHSEVQLTCSVQRILETMSGALPQFKSVIASNHLLKATLVTASLYDQDKDRFLDLKRQLGHCEVNICIDEFNISSHIHLRSQLFKSNLTMIEIIASKLEKDCWCITTKPREGISDELKRLQAAIGEALSNKQGKTIYSAFEFNQYWLRLDARTPPKLFCREHELPDYLKQLATFYSLALKDAIGTLHDPKVSRRAKIADLLSKTKTDHLSTTAYIECFQFK